MYTFIRNIRNINPRPKKINPKNIKHTGTIKDTDCRYVAIGSKVIVATTFSCEFRIYSLVTGNLIKSFPRIPGWTPSKIAIEKDLLVCGFSNGEIAVFSIRNSLKHLKTLEGHLNSISEIIIRGDLVVSSCVNEIKVWSLDRSPGSELIRTFIHPSFDIISNVYISSLDIQGDKIISGGYGGTIALWSLSKKPGEELIDVIKAHAHGINSLKLRNKQIISSGSDGTVKIWPFHKKTGKIFKFPRQLNHHLSRDSNTFATIQDNIIISWGNGQIKIWSIDNEPGKELIKTLSENNFAILFLEIQGNRIISRDETFMIKIWS